MWLRITVKETPNSPIHHRWCGCYHTNRLVTNTNNVISNQHFPPSFRQANAYSRLMTFSLLFTCEENSKSALQPFIHFPLIYAVYMLWGNMVWSSLKPSPLLYIPARVGQITIMSKQDLLHWGQNPLNCLLLLSLATSGGRWKFQPDQTDNERVNVYLPWDKGAIIWRLEDKGGRQMKEFPIGKLIFTVEK